MRGLCLCLPQPYSAGAVLPLRQGRSAPAGGGSGKADKARQRFEARQARIEQEQAEKEARRQARLEANRKKKEAGPAAANTVDTAALKQASLDASKPTKRP